MQTLHLAHEMIAIAVGAHGEKNYHASLIAALPHCKEGRTTDQLQLLRALLEVWYAEDGPHVTHGEC